MAKGDRVYAGTDEDARWIPSGAALVAYMKKRKEEAKMAEKGEGVAAVVQMPTMDDDAPAAVVDPDAAKVEGDDVEEERDELDEFNEAGLGTLAKEIFDGLSKEFGECPQCGTPSSRVISVSGNGKMELKCASGHDWSTLQQEGTSLQT